MGYVSWPIFNGINKVEYIAQFCVSQSDLIYTHKIS